MPTGPRADKRAAIVAAARSVFGRDGYARANIDAIARTAGVSTRTLYKHFAGGKEQLFSVVIAESAAQVSDHLVALVARHLGDDGGTDLDRRLVDLGRDWVLAKAAYPEHFGLVRHITVEAPHFPRQAFAAWQDAGPRRAEGELATRIERLADGGDLRVDDPMLAAQHFLLLTVGAVQARTGRDDTGDIDADAIERIVSAGIATFLHGYRVRTS